MKFRFKNNVREEIINIPDKELKGLNGIEWRKVMNKYFHRWIIRHSTATFQRVFDK